MFVLCNQNLSLVLVLNCKRLLLFCLQTNFNTVLTREKMKKEHIINELTEKLRKVTQQQEKDKGEFCLKSQLQLSLDI